MRTTEDILSYLEPEMEVLAIEVEGFYAASVDSYADDIEAVTIDADSDDDWY